MKIILCKKSLTMHRNKCISNLILPFYLEKNRLHKFLSHYAVGFFCFCFGFFLFVFFFLGGGSLNFTMLVLFVIEFKCITIRNLWAEVLKKITTFLSMSCLREFCIPLYQNDLDEPGPDLPFDRLSFLKYSH